MPYLKILRPLNGLIAAVSVGLGYVCAAPAGRPVEAGLIAIAGFSAFFVSAFGNIINDVLDLEADRVNRPDRPIPSGGISRGTALVYGIVMLFVGLSLARAAGPRFLYMAFAVAVLLWLYSVKLKRVPLVGNLVVAFLTGFTLVYGGALTDSWRMSLVPACFAFLINLGREFLKTASDREGDAAAGLDTLAVRFGVKACIRGACASLLLLMLLTPVPYMNGMYGKVYLVVAGVGVNMPLVAVVFLLLRGVTGRRALDRFSLALKILMVIGIIAILAGKGGLPCGVAFSG